MDPIDFEEMNGTAAKNQPPYRPLPMYRDGEQVISCWKMSLAERVKVFTSGVVWLRLIHSWDQAITPSLLEAESPFTLSDFAEDLTTSKKESPNVMDVLEAYFEEACVPINRRAVEEYREYLNELIEPPKPTKRSWSYLIYYSYFGMQLRRFWSVVKTQWRLSKVDQHRYTPMQMILDEEFDYFAYNRGLTERRTMRERATEILMGKK